MGLVPLTEEMFREVTGDYPQKSIRGFAFVDGEVKSIFGVYAQESRFVLFCDMKSEARKEMEGPVGKRRAVACMKKAKEFLGSLNAPVHVLADKHIEASARFLERSGFKRLHGDIYKWVSTQQQ